MKITLILGIVVMCAFAGIVLTANYPGHARPKPSPDAFSQAITNTKHAYFKLGYQAGAHDCMMDVLDSYHHKPPSHFTVDSDEVAYTNEVLKVEAKP